MPVIFVYIGRKCLGRKCLKECQMFREMRRKDRQMAALEAETMLKKHNFGMLSVSGDDGYPYGVPVNYGYVFGKFYIHSTSDSSHKLDAINRNPKVCMTVIDKNEIDVPNITTHYRSVIVFGTARIITDAAEKRSLLNDMMKSISSNTGVLPVKGCPNTDGLVMIEITPEHCTGKVRA